MASKGPKSDTATPVANPVVKTPRAIKPPVAPRAVPAPLAAQPAPVLPAAAPAVATALAATAAVTPPAPAVAAPVIAPQLPNPVAAPAATLPEKDVTMETVTNTAETAQNQAHAAFDDANDRTKAAMEKGSKMLADLNDFSKGNIEAVVESSKIAAKGAEDVARYTTDYAKATVEKANAAARQFASIKSPTELMKLQSDYAKDAMDSLMAETAKFTENYLKLLGEIAQPISNRVALAAEKMKIAA